MTTTDALTAELFDALTDASLLRHLLDTAATSEERAKENLEMCMKMQKYLMKVYPEGTTLPREWPEAIGNLTAMTALLAMMANHSDELVKLAVDNVRFVETEVEHSLLCSTVLGIYDTSNGITDAAKMRAVWLMISSLDLLEGLGK